MAELLASSNSRKKELVSVASKLQAIYVSLLKFSLQLVTFIPFLQVQQAVNDLRESATNKTNKLQQEMTTMQDSTSTVKAKWVIHMEKTESHYLEDTAAVECGKKDLEEVLHNWCDNVIPRISICY